LDAGHDVNQVSDEEKAKVSDDVKKVIYSLWLKSRQMF
jgi:hypothetical protein